MLPAIPVEARIESVVLGVQLAHVVVRVGENRLIGKFIPRSYAEELDLQMGKTITTRVSDSDIFFLDGLQEFGAECNFAHAAAR
jgi:molybdopterin-binding protein